MCNTLNRYRNTASKKLHKIMNYHNNYSLRIVNWSRGPCAEKKSYCLENFTKILCISKSKILYIFQYLKSVKILARKNEFTDCNKFKEKIAPFFTKLTICTVIQNTIFGTQYISVFAEHSVEISGFFCHSNFT